MVMPEREYYSSRYRFGFNGQEHDRELNPNITTATFWEYDARLGRRWNLDPKPVVPMSGYATHMCNPICFIDQNGDSAVVLIAPAGASGAGHMAILIQGKDMKWSLYSKNGTHGLKGAYGDTPRGVPHTKDEKAPQYGEGSFNSPEDFLKDNSLNPINKETGKREYTEGFLIPLTKDQDRKAENGAKSELDKKKYNVVGSNCATTVQSALRAAGKKDGTPSFLRRMIVSGISTTLAVVDEKMPRLIYNRIKSQNSEGYVVPVKTDDDK